MSDVNIVQLHYSPPHALPWMTLFTLFFRFAINLKGENIKLC
jgi:hypothetical protein